MPDITHSFWWKCKALFLSLSLLVDKLFIPLASTTWRWRLSICIQSAVTQSGLHSGWSLNFKLYAGRHYRQAVSVDLPSNTYKLLTQYVISSKTSSLNVSRILTLLRWTWQVNFFVRTLQHLQLNWIGSKINFKTFYIVLIFKLFIFSDRKVHNIWWFFLFICNIIN